MGRYDNQALFPGKSGKFFENMERKIAEAERKVSEQARLARRAFERAVSYSSPTQWLQRQRALDEAEYQMKRHEEVPREDWRSLRERLEREHTPKRTRRGRR
jgi:hypothetical protein